MQRHRDPEEVLGHQRARAADSLRWIGILDLRPGMEAADLGSGPGLVALQMAERVRPDGRVWAVDRSVEMVERARRLVAEAAMETWVRPLQADLARVEPGELPIPPGSLDRILIANVLHHVERRVHFLALARSLLRPQGRLLVVEFDPGRGLRFGPPVEERLTSADLEEAAGEARLALIAGGDAGEAWYHRLFTPA
ncbi:MAG: class I SAM-dependent methyltransferase [Bacillota bacterium]|nr:class I SAM-dependent methyltransferase [Bacillota bacterium]